jgi:hypothetical protein
MEAIGLAKVHLLLLKDRQNRPQSGAEGGAGIPRRRQDRADVGRAGLTQRGDAGRGPGAMGRHGPGEVEPGGDLCQGTAPERGGCAVQHDGEPAAQLAGHRLGKPVCLAVEPGLDRGDTVVFDHPGLGEDVQALAHGVPGSGQDGSVGGGNRDAGAVDEAEQNPHAGADCPGHSFAPAVAAGAVPDDRVDCRGQGRVGRTAGRRAAAPARTPRPSARPAAAGRPAGSRRGRPRHLTILRQVCGGRIGWAR